MTVILHTIDVIVIICPNDKICADFLESLTDLWTTITTLEISLEANGSSAL